MEEIDRKGKKNTSDGVILWRIYKPPFKDWELLINGKNDDQRREIRI